MGRGRTRVGGNTDALSICLTERTRHVDRSRWVWWRTWVVIIICLTKQTRHVNSSIWVWWRTWVLCRPYMWVPDCQHIFMCHNYHVKHISKQCNLDRLKSGSRRDTNETPICAVPMHAPQTNALWWGEEGGTTKAPLYTLPRRVGDVEGRSILSGCWDEAQRRARDRLFIAKTEMAMGCRGMGGEHAGVKCGCMQGCCEGARQGVRSWRAMVQVAMSTKTNKIGAAARQSWVLPLRSEGGNPPQWSSTWCR